MIYHNTDAYLLDRWLFLRVYAAVHVGGYVKPRGKRPQCGADKKWIGLDLSKGDGCQPKDCKTINIAHGRLNGKTTYDDDNVVSVLCNTGYHHKQHWVVYTPAP